eukprot:507227_1
MAFSDDDFPELPEEFGDVKAVTQCDVYSFYKILQSPWQNSFVDVRDVNKFKKLHPRYTINIPLTMEEKDMSDVIKNDIETQQNIILNLYIYTDHKADDEDKMQKHYSTITDILNTKYTLFPQVFVFNDTNNLLEQKYPFLCVNDDVIVKDDEKIPDKVREMRNFLKSMAPKQPKKKTIVTLMSERVGYYLEYPDQIINDRLFLGDYNAATRPEIMQHLHITHIVNCTKEKNEFEKDKCLNIKYFQMPINDYEYEPIGVYFEAAIQFIDSAMKTNEKNKIFIHCHAGVSRSGAITIAYMMKCHLMSMEVALQYVQERRECVDPNKGFRIQLLHFEKYGYKIDKKVLKKELNELCNQ